MDDFEIDRLPVKSAQLPGEKEPLRWYVRPISKSFEATNHIHMAASTWINLAQLTGDKNYRYRAITAIKVFKKVLSAPGVASYTGTTSRSLQ